MKSDLRKQKNLHEYAPDKSGMQKQYALLKRHSEGHREMSFFQ